MYSKGGSDVRPCYLVSLGLGMESSSNNDEVRK